MASRVFGQLDVSGIVEGYTAGPVTNNSTFNLSNVNFGNFGFNGIGSDAGLIGGGVSANGTYSKTGTVNFQSGVNPVPNDAIITKVRVRIPIVLNCHATAHDSIGASAVLDCNVADRIVINETFTDPNNVDQLWFESILGSSADQIFDFSTSPIDVATLIAMFGSPILTISITNYIAAYNANGDAIADFGIQIQNWEIEVFWTLMFKWTVAEPDVAADVGSVITLLSPETVISPDVAVDFTEVTAIDILIPDYTTPGTFITVSVPQIDWTFISAHLLTFIMPSWGGLFPTVVRVRLTSTQFGGSVERKIRTIFFASASGIYALFPGQTHDVLYIEEEPGETIDVKIPNPFGKTGPFAK